MQVWASRLAVGGFVGLFLLHFAFVWKLSVNIASDDEWGIFRTPGTLSLRWIWWQHNEHRIVLTKFFIWLQYHLNGWNHRTHVLLNFIIYGVLLWWLIYFARKLSPRIPVWVILGFAVFLLSPILWMNHLIGLQDCFHFWLLFLLISTYFLFGPTQNGPRLLIGCLAGILSLYSLATGLSSSAVVLFLFLIFKATRAYSARGPERRREVRQLALVAAILICATGFYFLGYRTSSNSRGVSLPYQLTFWRLFLNLVSFAFGIDEVSTTLGALCFLIVVVPMVWQAGRQQGKLSSGQWTAYVTVIAILATLASVAAGRAPFGIEWSKVSRYAEIGMPLIILSALNWSWVLQGTRRWRVSVLVALWIFCAMAFADNWSFEIYRQRAAAKRIGLRCVQAYYENGINDRCPELQPRRMSVEFENARQLNVSFYRQIMARIEFDKRQEAKVAAVASPSYSGQLDVADCEVIGGWATKSPRPPKPLIVAIYDGNRLVSTDTAGLVRADVYDAGAGPLLCGFSFPTPPDLKDGQPHPITVKIAGTSYDLGGTPKVLRCSPR